MARNNRNRSEASENNSNRYGGVMTIAREQPARAAVYAAAAVGAGVFLWSRRNQISEQISNFSGQIGDWSQNMGLSGSESSGGDTSMNNDTAGLTTSGGAASAGMSEMGGGNASLGASTGGGGGGATSSATGRGRVQQSPTT
jgi:hypothetical protein